MFRPLILMLAAAGSPTPVPASDNVTLDALTAYFKAFAMSDEGADRVKDSIR
jgi:hypothetical protein